jgi:hypothetical protein
VKKIIILFLFFIAVNANAAKMAYFRGDSFLSWADSAAYNIGSTDPYKVKCKIRLSPQDGWTCWLGGAPLHLGNIGYYEAGNFHPGEAGWAGGTTGGYGWIVSGHRIDDGLPHDLEFERVADGTFTIKVDSVIVFTQNGNTWSNGTYPGNYRWQWQLGGWAYTQAESEQNYFTGFISDFELYINGNREIYLPLTGDLQDHSGNEVPVTNDGAGKVIIADTDSIISCGSIETIVADSGGNWTLMPQTVIVAGNLSSSYGITKTGAVIYCENLNLVTTGKKLKTASLIVTYTDIGGGLGLGGAGVKAKIRAQDTANPADVTNANDFIASAKTDAYVEIDQTYTNGQTVAYDISSIITELLAYGNLSRINLMYDDNDGRTTVTDGCYIGSNYSVYIELEDMNASSSTGLRVPWKH